jgi:arylformamidase
MIYDITQPISESMKVYSGDPTVSIEALSDVSAGAPYSLSKISMGSHTGTHVDAPSHLMSGGNTMDNIALDTLVGPCTVVNCDTDMDISIQDLERMKLPSDTKRLLVRTRRSAGYLSRGAAANLVEAGVILVGIDSSSVDAPASQDLAVHQTLLRAETVIIENLALDSIEPGNYWLVCLPLRLQGCDGAPARAILMDSAPQATPITSGEVSHD